MAYKWPLAEKGQRVGLCVQQAIIPALGFGNSQGPRIRLRASPAIALNRINKPVPTIDTRTNHLSDGSSCGTSTPAVCHIQTVRGESSHASLGDIGGPTYCQAHRAGGAPRKRHTWQAALLGHTAHVQV